MQTNKKNYTWFCSVSKARASLQKQPQGKCKADNKPISDITTTEKKKLKNKTKHDNTNDFSSFKSDWIGRKSVVCLAWQ